MHEALQAVLLHETLCGQDLQQAILQVKQAAASQKVKRSEGPDGEVTADSFHHIVSPPERIPFRSKGSHLQVCGGLAH